MTSTAIDLLHDRARNKGLKFTQELSKNLPDTVIGDPARLRQMMVILIGIPDSIADESALAVTAIGICRSWPRFFAALRRSREILARCCRRRKRSAR